MLFLNQETWKNCRLESPFSDQGSNMCTKSRLVNTAHSFIVKTAMVIWGRAAGVAPISELSPHQQAWRRLGGGKDIFIVSLHQWVQIRKSYNLRENSHTLSEEVNLLVRNVANGGGGFISTHPVLEKTATRAPAAFLSHSLQCTNRH